MTAGPFSPETVWQADQDQFLAEEFGDTMLVYHRPSGDTHFLSFLPADALKSVVQQPANMIDLHAHLMKMYDFSEEDLPIQLVQDAIGQLDETGLICPIRCSGNQTSGAN